MHPSNISIDSYDYPLPDERIAKFPLAVRDQSKMLIYENGQIQDARFFAIVVFIGHFNRYNLVVAHFYPRIRPLEIARAAVAIEA